MYHSLSSTSRSEKEKAAVQTVIKDANFLEVSRQPHPIHAHPYLKNSKNNLICVFLISWNQFPRYCFLSDEEINNK